MTKFTVGWSSGSSAQIELFSREGAKAGYHIKYTSPFRPTMRAPVERCPLGPGELAPINEDLDRLARGLTASRGGGGEPSAAPVPAAGGKDATMAAAETVGQMLFSLVIPKPLERDLSAAGLFLELGIDEKLIEYPWELMHDRQDFLCLKHNVGRFVNAREMGGSASSMRQVQREVKNGPLSVLLISVPNPQPRAGGVVYEPLTEAIAETKAVADTLGAIDGVTVTLLKDEKATYKKVYEAVSQAKYDIVHFAGHALFDKKQPANSGLVLWDKEMTTGPLSAFFGMTAPTFCFINACESAKASTWKARYDTFGVGRSFLETGSYLLGTRWRVGDEAASAFAPAFYTSLLVQAKSIGEAVRDARTACKAASKPDNLAWASYVLFGDPRVTFIRQAEA